MTSNGLPDFLNTCDGLACIVHYPPSPSPICAGSQSKNYIYICIYKYIRACVPDLISPGGHKVMSRCQVFSDISAKSSAVLSEANRELERQ